MKQFYALFAVLLCGFLSQAQPINFPDANFKAKLLAASETTFIAFDLNWTRIKIDTNNDGEISVAEAQTVSRLSISSSNIANLTGINNFTNLVELNCGYNQLTALDVSGIPGLLKLVCQNNTGLSNLNITNCNALTDLDCDNSQLATLDVSNRTNLVSLSCYNSQISNLNISNCPNLVTLECSANQLTTLNVANLAQLTGLYCSSNQLTSLDLTGLTSLTDLSCILNQLTSLNVNHLINLSSLGCGGNQLTTLDVSNLVNLTNLNCHSNQIQYLDVSQSPLLQTLICKNNNITYLNLKNGYNYSLADNELIYSYSIKQNPLYYVCADENKIQALEDHLAFLGVNINSYCSFEPGGTFYTVQGNHRFDANNNGCDGNDPLLPNQNFNIFNGSSLNTFVSDASGNYSLALPSGSYTITPLFENPTYFNVSPTFVNATFPGSTNPTIQDFCITPNGTHNDLEIAIFPLLPARPGFNASYKIVYKNKGNQILSGSVLLQFEDNLMDFVMANPAVSGQSPDILSWNYGNLQPFETREIDVTMNINAPSDTPSVTIGEELTFTAQINPTVGDDTVGDNLNSLKQIVVGAFDPNDKTCTEGTTVTTSVIGAYVHYIIRFENTGNFAAENVVVKDIIDTTKLNIATLVPLYGSHPFVTRISDNNRVEFVFENINLPFDDANNDGFIAFKIKTRATLSVGQSFSNSASIYFDYNLPIVTNTYTTTIEALATSDFDFDAYFSIFPNPSNGNFNLLPKTATAIRSLEIYNPLGQIVMAFTAATDWRSVDISRLSSGTYFVKVYTEKGTAAKKIARQ